MLVFAVLIYWQGWWLLSACLIFSNLWRGINYFDEGLVLHAALRTLSITPVEPRPVVFVNAALMALLVIRLARSAWIGFSDWRTRRLIERES